MTKLLSCSWKLSKLKRAGFLGFEIMPLAYFPGVTHTSHSFIHSFSMYLLVDAPNISLGVEDTLVDNAEEENPSPFGAYIPGRIYRRDMC